MRLDEQLPDRGPGAPVRPGGGSRMPALIVLVLVVTIGGIFLAPQIRELGIQFWDAQTHSREPEPAWERTAPPPAREPARPITSQASWVTNDDYPPEALPNGEQGSVGIEFIVAPNGRISDCKVVQSSGSNLLDRTTCTLITERGLYSPALDAKGRAVAQTSRLRFLWQIAD